MIENIFKKLLNRNATPYELSIYSAAINSGLSEKALEGILCESPEYKFLSKKESLHLYSENPKNNYNIALCLSGHARNIEVTIPYIEKNIIKPYNADVFIHCWAEKGTQILGRNKTGISYSSEQSNLKYLDDIKKTRFKCEYMSNVEPQFRLPNKYYVFGGMVNKDIMNSTALPKNIISQFYSIYQSYKMAKDFSLKENKKYDIIIKSRLDFLPLSVLNEADFFDGITILSKSTTNSGFDLCSNCNEHQDEHLNFVNDFFSFGPPNKMEKWMTLYLSYGEIYKKMISNSDLSSVNIFMKNGISFINNIEHAKNKAPCFFPENILRFALKGIQLKESSMVGYVSRLKYFYILNNFFFCFFIPTKKML